MDNRPIGVFDSGLGGLTAVRELRRILPGESIIYFGDTGRVPYGSRSRDIIIKYTQQDIAFLRSKDVKIVIAACGTASSAAAQVLEELDLPATGVLRPTARAAAKATKNGRIGVIATTATIRSGAFRRELEAIDSRLEIFEQDCPLFVPLVENGFVEPDNEVTRLVAEKYLLPLREQKIDTLIMGCTHYPIISRIIGNIMGDVRLIDSGRETALYAAELLRDNGLAGDGTSNKVRFFVSDQTEGFEQIAGIFLGQDLKRNVQRIEIDKIAV